MYELIRQEDDRIEMRFTDRITHEDLDRVSADMERLSAGRSGLRVLCRMPGTAAYEDVGAFVRDMAINVRFNGKVERFGLVGDRTWHAWGTQLLKPFAHGEVRYFDEAETAEAWAWLSPSGAAPAPAQEPGQAKPGA